MALNPSAQKVQHAINALGYTNQVVEMPDSTRTAQEAADAVGCTLGQIVKSLIFKGKASGQPVLVIASGANRVKEKKVETLLGEKITKPDADFVREQTGYAIGGVPPLAHPQPLTTIIDEDLLQYEAVWAAAGTPHAVFEVTPDDLVKMTGGQVAAIKAE